MENFTTWLTANLPTLTTKQALLGFDGFIDRPAKLPTMPTMTALSQYLAEREGTSGALEIEEAPEKMGGNMPITANALASLGVSCQCIGAVNHPIFETMHPNCTLHPVAPPGTCLALEFAAGKLMLADNKPIEGLNYATVKSALPALHQSTQLWAYLNWSELPHMTEILQGIQRDILPQHKAIALFDLSDCSTRPPEEIKTAMTTMAAFEPHATTVLSLNGNEANQLQKVYQLDSLEALYQTLGITNLIIRKNKDVYGFTPQGMVQIQTKYVQKTKLLTGAGDNFNAGIAAGLLMGGTLAQALTLGTTVSSYYIANGISPTPQNLLESV